MSLSALGKEKHVAYFRDINIHIWTFHSCNIVSSLKAIFDKSKCLLLLKIVFNNGKNVDIIIFCPSNLRFYDTPECFKRIDF